MTPVRVFTFQRPDCFLQLMSVRRLDSLVVLFSRIHDLETEFLVEFDGTIIVHLDVAAKRQVIRKTIRDISRASNKGDRHSITAKLIEVNAQLSTLAS